MTGCCSPNKLASFPVAIARIEAPIIPCSPNWHVLTEANSLGAGTRGLKSHSKDRMASYFLPGPLDGSEHLWYTNVPRTPLGSKFTRRGAAACVVPPWQLNSSWAQPVRL